MRIHTSMNDMVMITVVKTMKMRTMPKMMNMPRAMIMISIVHKKTTLTQNGGHIVRSKTINPLKQRKDLGPQARSSHQAPPSRIASCTWVCGSFGFLGFGVLGFGSIRAWGRIT